MGARPLPAGRRHGWIRARHTSRSSTAWRRVTVCTRARDGLPRRPRRAPVQRHRRQASTPTPARRLLHRGGARARLAGGRSVCARHERALDTSSQNSKAAPARSRSTGSTGSRARLGSARSPGHRLSTDTITGRPDASAAAFRGHPGLAPPQPNPPLGAGATPLAPPGPGHCSQGARGRPRENAEPHVPSIEGPRTESDGPLPELRQEATHRKPRVRALILFAALTACALAFAVGSALAAPSPDTSITAGPSGTYRSGSAQFTLSSPTGGATFECSLDGAPFEACSSQPSFEVANGSHRVEARAVLARHARPDPGGAHLVGRRELPERELRDGSRRLDQPGLHGAGLRLERGHSPGRRRWPGRRKEDGPLHNLGLRLPHDLDRPRSVRRDQRGRGPHRARLDPRADERAHHLPEAARVPAGRHR